MATCAASDCGKDVPWGMLMCKPHWFAVSKPTRDAVWSTWKALHLIKTPEMLRAYRAARDQAIDEVSLAQTEYDRRGDAEPGYE